MRPVRPTAVLFDLDGVLVDSYEAWFQTVRGTARGFGLPDIPRERFAGTWGQGISADLDLFPGRTYDEVAAAYEREMPAQHATVVVNPEARVTLLALRARGIPRACVTNTQVVLARAVLIAANLLDAFDDVQGARPSVREKPHPDLLLAALATLGHPPGGALMVGDSRFDEEGAAAARVPFLHYDLREGKSLGAAVLGRIEGA